MSQKTFDYIKEYVGLDSYNKGLNYTKENVRPWETFKNKIDNSDVYVFNVDSSNSLREYSVTVEVKNNKINYAHCNCPRYYEYDTCKHLAAVLLLYKHMLLEKDVDILSISKNILNQYYKPKTNEIKLKKQMNLEL